MVTEDVSWLGLEPHGEGMWRLELKTQLGRGDGKLYGGTGLALSVALMESVTDRDALYCTTQFSGSANTGAQLDCRVEVLASGRRSSQLRITVFEGDRLVLTSLGATGEHNDHLEVQVPVMPDVPGPEHAEDWMARFRLPDQPPRTGWAEIAELKRVELPDGHFAMWGRMRNHKMTRAGLGFIADFVPVSVTRARRESTARASASTTRFVTATSSTRNGCCSTSTPGSRRAATCTARSGCGRRTAPCSASRVRPPPVSSVRRCRSSSVD